MNSKKILYILLIAISIIYIYTLDVYATDDIIQGADDFLSSSNENILNKEKIKEVSDMIFNIFIAVGTCIVVLIGAVLGIKFLFGSIEEKAEIKETIMPYATGAIVIFGAITIWSLCVKVFQNIF